MELPNYHNYLDYLVTFDQKLPYIEPYLHKRWKLKTSYFSLVSSVSGAAPNPAESAKTLNQGFGVVRNHGHYIIILVVGSGTV